MSNPCGSSSALPPACSASSAQQPSPRCRVNGHMRPLGRARASLRSHDCTRRVVATHAASVCPRTTQVETLACMRIAPRRKPVLGIVGRGRGASWPLNAQRRRRLRNGRGARQRGRHVRRHRRRGGRRKRGCGARRRRGRGARRRGRGRSTSTGAPGRSSLLQRHAAGSKPGYVLKKGPKGLGYYKDNGNAALDPTTAVPNRFDPNSWEHQRMLQKYNAGHKFIASATCTGSKPGYV